MQESPLELVCFTLIIDDIVSPNGETFMAQLGGGGSQTLFGYQLASASISSSLARVGLAAGIGPDLPASCRNWMASIGVDLLGLLLVEGRDTPRAWQVFEQDGRRTQIWRSKGDPCDALYAMLRPRLDTLPPHFLASQNFHLGAHPVRPPLDLMRGLHSRAKAAGGFLSVEPFCTADRVLTSQELQDMLGCCDIYSPNLLEAQSMLGTGDSLPPTELAWRLLESGGPSGAPLVVLRCGEHGSVIAYKPTGATYTVPAVKDVVVTDVTGAGNAFCGGFLASLITSSKNRAANTSSSSPVQQLSTAQILEASAWGAVCASFMIEEQGVPLTHVQELAPRARRRLEAVQKGVTVDAADTVQPFLQQTGSEHACVSARGQRSHIAWALPFPALLRGTPQTEAMQQRHFLRSIGNLVRPDKGVGARVSARSYSKLSGKSNLANLCIV